MGAAPEAGSEGGGRLLPMLAVAGTLGVGGGTVGARDVGVEGERGGSPSAACSRKRASRSPG